MTGILSCLGSWILLMVILLEVLKILLILYLHREDLERLKEFP